MIVQRRPSFLFRCSEEGNQVSLPQRLVLPPTAQLAAGLSGKGLLHIILVVLNFLLEVAPAILNGIAGLGFRRSPPGGGFLMEAWIEVEIGQDQLDWLP